MSNLFDRLNLSLIPLSVLLHLLIELSLKRISLRLSFLVNLNFLLRNTFIVGAGFIRDRADLHTALLISNCKFRLQFSSSFLFNSSLFRCAALTCELDFLCAIGSCRSALFELGSTELVSMLHLLVVRFASELDLRVGLESFSEFGSSSTGCFDVNLKRYWGLHLVRLKKVLLLLNWLESRLLNLPDRKSSYQQITHP